MTAMPNASYKLLQAYCYYEGAAGYTKDLKKAAKLAADVGDNRYVQALIGNETTLSGLSLIRKECLPGASWSFDTSGSSTLESPVRRPPQPASGSFF